MFPFDFRSPESINRLFSRTALLENTADAIDNLLLFIPLGFSLRICFRSTQGYLFASFLAILFLGLGLQLVQLYLPSRTASLADVVWNGIGLATGLLAASSARKWLVKQKVSWTDVSPFPLLLVMLWFFYEAFPFVPTLDYGLLREHVKTAIIAPPFETVRFIQHLLAATLCGIALQRVQLFGRSGLTTVLVGSATVLLEILVAYGQLRLETLIGMVVGLASGYQISKSGDKLALMTLAVIATCVYLMTIFSPFRGQIADAGFTLTPFSSFMWHNVTRELPPLALETLGIGSLLWAGLFRPGIFRRRPILWVGIVLLTVALLEVVRVRIVGIHGDTTPLLITVLLGSFASTYRDRQGSTIVRLADSSNPADTQHYQDCTHLPERPNHIIALVLLAAAIYAVSRLPGIPYNIRELLPHGSDGILAAFCLSAALYLAVNSPFALLTGESRRRLVLFPLLLPLQGTIIWILLRIGIPLESIHDIVGAPTKGWPWEWEMFLRFLALHQAIATQMVGAVLLITTLRRPALLTSFLYWLFVSLLLAWPLHLVVVEWAATDNLTELMRDNAAFSSSSLLALSLLFIAIGGSAIGAALSSSASRRRALFASAVLAALLSAASFMAGTEPVLVKYGKVFSTAQFLLSPDRNNYLPESELLIRFALAYALCTAVIAFIQARAWSRLTTR